MLNAVWVLLIAGALICGAATGQLDAVSEASVESAKRAVELVIGLIGVMAFWLGAMQVLVKAGLVRALARVLAPVLRRLFPGVPPEHPAMGMMLMNISANALGLGNAATPFGLKAMLELDRLNQNKGVATNAMVRFLAINTSGVALLPTNMIALRASLGSASPGAIIVPTLLATLASTAVAIFVSGRLEGRRAFAGPAEAEAGEVRPVSLEVPDADEAPEAPASPPLRRALVGALSGLVVGGVIWALAGVAAEQDSWLSAFDVAATRWSLALLIGAIVLVGAYRGVAVFDAVVDGAQDAFRIAVKLVPYFIALLVAIGMFRASGAIDLLVGALSTFTEAVGFPAEALPMALLRPLSGKAAFAVAAETMEAHGPDSPIGYVVSTLQGSTETTFYVLALYFGVVGVRHGRHALVSCLSADLVGALTTAWVCAWLLF